MLTLRPLVGSLTKGWADRGIMCSARWRNCLGQKRHVSSSETKSVEDAKPSELTFRSTGRKIVPRQIIDDEEAECEDLVSEREFTELKLEDYEELYRDEPEMKDLISQAISEYEFQKYNTFGRVPTTLDVESMHRLVTENESATKRQLFLNYLFKREMVKRAGLRRKERSKDEKQKQREMKFENSENERTGLLSYDGKINYGLWHNSLFTRIPEKHLNSGNSLSRLRTAAMFGPKLVFDFDFEQHMSVRTMRNTVDQLLISYGLNRHNYEEPFDLWFCNFNRESEMGKFSDKTLQNLHTSSMITIKKDCFTKHFDRSRLVYLTPNSREVLTRVEPDKVYIIGAFNDKGIAKPLSYRKAERLRIDSRCLPLDKHLAWGQGAKSLCMNHVIGILLEYNANGGNWREALTKYVPKRKIKPVETLMEEEMLRRQKYDRRRR